MADTGTPSGIGWPELDELAFPERDETVMAPERRHPGVDRSVGWPELNGRNELAPLDGRSGGTVVSRETFEPEPEVEPLEAGDRAVSDQRSPWPTSAASGGAAASSASTPIASGGGGAIRVEPPAGAAPLPAEASEDQAESQAGSWTPDPLAPTKGGGAPAPVSSGYLRPRDAERRPRSAEAEWAGAGADEEVVDAPKPPMKGDAGTAAHPVGSVRGSGTDVADLPGERGTREGTPDAEHPEESGPEESRAEPTVVDRDPREATAAERDAVESPAAAGPLSADIWSRAPSVEPEPAAGVEAPATQDGSRQGPLSQDRAWVEAAPSEFDARSAPEAPGDVRLVDAATPRNGAVGETGVVEDLEEPRVEPTAVAEASGEGADGEPTEVLPRLPLLDDSVPLPDHGRVLVVANQKGGVGKTTTAVNLAAALVAYGARVLVVDLDPQGNASTALGIAHQEDIEGMYEVLIGERTMAEVVRETPGVPGLYGAPATIKLAGAEIELVSFVARESRLKRPLESYLAEVTEAGERFDYVLIDCPPSLGLLTLNALVGAKEVLIPIQCEYYALEGVSQLLRTIDLVQRELNQDLWVSTVILTMYDGRTRLAAGVAEEVRAHFGDRVLRTAVPRSVRISEAPSYGQTVITHDPTSSGALSYLEAAREFALL